MQITLDFTPNWWAIGVIVISLVILAILPKE